MEIIGRKARFQNAYLYEQVINCVIFVLFLQEAVYADTSSWQVFIHLGTESQNK